jgi:hypothetical protein
MRLGRLVSLCFLLVACGGHAPPPRHVQPPPPPPPSGPPAPVRIIHASPDPTVARVALTVDGRIVEQELAFGAATAYQNVEAGSHVVAILPRDAPPSAPAPLSETYHLVGPDASTLIVHGIAGGSPRLGFTYTSDFVDPPDPGKARLRFFHAAVGLGAVEVCEEGRSPHHAGPRLFLESNEGAFLRSGTEGAVGIWTQVPAGARVIQLRIPDPGRACHGLVLGSIHLDVPEGALVTLVAVGRVDADPAVDPAVLVCRDDAGGSAAGCSSVQLETGR